MAETKLNDNQLAQAGLDGESAAAVLTEIQTKYAQGKIALAKALTSRGKATSSKEEILSMASKVYEIVPSDDTENIYAKMLQGTTTGAMNTIDKNTSWCELNAQHDVVLNKSGTLYYLPYGAYRNIDELLAGVKYSLVINSAGHSYQIIGASVDGSKVAVFATQYKLQVYDVTESGFVLLHEATLTTYPSSYCRLAVSNDGKLVVFQRNGSNLTYLDCYNFTTNTQTQIQNVFGGDQPQSYNEGAELLLTDSELFTLFRTNKYTSYCGLSKTTYEKAADGTITWGTAQAVAIQPADSKASYRPHFYRYAQDPVVYWATSYNVDTKKCCVSYYLRAGKCSELLKMSEMASMEICVYPSNFSYANTGDSPYHPLVEPLSGNLDVEGDLLLFRSARFTHPLMFNLSTSQWSTQRVVFADNAGNGNNSYGLGEAIMDNADTGVMIFPAYGTSDNITAFKVFYTSAYFTFAQFTKDIKLIGKKYVGPSGKETWFVFPNKKAPEDVNAGYFDVQISVEPETGESV